MIIQVDSREHAHAITGILKTFDANGVKHFISKLPVGDYMSFDNPRLVIDRKRNLLELAENVVQDHDRFRRELENAQKLERKLIVLVEHGKGIKSLDDVFGWVNPRLKTSPMAVSGERLHKILNTMSIRYSVEFLFCDKKQTGAKIIELLKENRP